MSQKKYHARVNIKKTGVRMRVRLTLDPRTVADFKAGCAMAKGSVMRKLRTHSDLKEYRFGYPDVELREATTPYVSI